MNLPAVIQEIVGIIGHGPAMDLVRAFGGQELRVPKTDASDTWAALVEIIGEPLTKDLAAVYQTIIRVERQALGLDEVASTATSWEEALLRIDAEAA